VFNSKKKKILSTGIQARAIVTDVADTGMTVNDNPRVKLTLQVMPEGETPFEVTKKVTVSRVSIPRVGSEFWVRYSPEDRGKVEFDEAKVAELNASAKSQALGAAAAAASLPPDLAERGILGRATIKDVQRNPVGQLVECIVKLGVRLVDGTPAYEATTRATLGQDTAARLVPGQLICSVRADPSDHSRVALSLSDPTPVVTVTEPELLGPPERALREGAPCRVVILLRGRQFIQTPDGDELWATRVRVVGDGSEFPTALAVPASATALFNQDGKELPAKRLLAANVVAVDWEAAARESGVAVA
jgi:hypothetical protein